MTLFDRLLQGSFDAGLNYEFWPAPDAGSKKFLLVLHGRGDSPRGFHFLPAALGIDSLNTLFLEAPDAYGPGFSWYGIPPHQGPGILRSRALLFALLGRLQAEGIAATDIFVLGFSQGCLMTLDLALRYPKRLGGFVGISGYVYFEEEYPQAFSPVATKQCIWVSHGHQDEALPFARSESSVQRLRSQGITIEWVPLDKEHTVDPVDEIPLIRAFLLTQLDSN